MSYRFDAKNADSLKPTRSIFKFSHLFPANVLFEERFLFHCSIVRFRGKAAYETPLEWPLTPVTRYPLSIIRYPFALSCGRKQLLSKWHFWQDSNQSPEPGPAPASDNCDNCLFAPSMPARTKIQSIDWNPEPRKGVKPTLSWEPGHWHWHCHSWLLATRNMSILTTKSLRPGYAHCIRVPEPDSHPDPLIPLSPQEPHFAFWLARISRFFFFSSFPVTFHPWHILFFHMKLKTEAMGPRSHEIKRSLSGLSLLWAEFRRWHLPNASCTPLSCNSRLATKNYGLAYHFIISIFHLPSCFFWLYIFLFIISAVLEVLSESSPKRKHKHWTKLSHLQRPGDRWQVLAGPGLAVSLTIWLPRVNLA